MNVHYRGCIVWLYKGDVMNIIKYKFLSEKLVRMKMRADKMDCGAILCHT